ncbi:MAG: transporter permease, partial [Bacilli bacterium]|nr:transporter permease [Bacilli bacterium]
MRIRALTIRICRQFLHDKRSLALMLVAPLLILTLVSLVFNGTTYQPKIGIVDVPTAITQGLSQANVALNSYPSSASALESLSKQNIDAYIDMQEGKPHVVLEGSDPSKNKAILLSLQKLTLPASSNAAVGLAPQQLSYLYGSASMTSFDNFGPVLIGFFAFFFVFLVAGISFLKERTTGTLERLIAAPIKRWEIVAGYVVGFGIFTTIQAILIAWFSVDVLGIMMTGHLINLLLVTLL